MDQNHPEIDDELIRAGPNQKRNSSHQLTEESPRNIRNSFILKSYHPLCRCLASAVVMKDSDGKSKCFGFVNFENADDAARSVEALNGNKFDDKEWYVGKAQKKFERETELKVKFELSMKEAEEKFQGANLYVKNLDDTTDDEKLRELFSSYGTIVSFKV